MAPRRREVPAFDDDVWELYDTNKDWSQANDMAKEIPEKLHELQRLWLIEAVKYNVLPLDDDLGSAHEPGHRGAAVLIREIASSSSPAWADWRELRLNIKNKSHSVTAESKFRNASRPGRDHRPGREHWRLDALRQRRQAQILLQSGRPQMFLVKSA